MTEQNQSFDRFSVARRVEHLVLILSFTLLALTGLPQKYPTAGVSAFLTALFGGIETLRVIHRVSATVFLVQSIYHLVVMGYKLYVLRLEATMLPGIRDVSDGLNSLLYNLGFKKERPKMGRYNFAEKIEYWALVWGLVIMALTGFMLWNPLATTSALSGEFIPAAKVAHGNEAVLAVLAIIIWHFYSVHLKRWNWSMIKGTLSREEMEEEHALELQQIEEGKRRATPTAAEYRKRMTVFVPLAAVFSIAGLFLVYKFVTIENTAKLTTILPSDAGEQVYVPLPTATLLLLTEAPTPEGGVKLTWEGGIGALFEKDCAMCHGNSGGLSVKTYANLIKGGASGPVIVPGDAAGSSLIVVQSGTHPKVFNPADLETVKAWIDAGAPEK